MARRHHLPKIAVYGELSTGYRDGWTLKKRFKDSLKKALGTCHIDHHQWSTLAAEDFHGVFQKLLEQYNKCIATGGDYFEGD